MVAEGIENIIPDDFSGCVFVKKHGNVIFHKAFGYADMPNRIPNETDTKFQTASAGKAFVATGILQLIEREQLAFGDTIGELLDLDLKAIDRDITVKQLLTHTSGIPDYFDESIMTDYSALWKDYPNYKIRTNADLIPLFIDKPMMYPKGERFQYNNTGYVVLGLIIERLSGVPFDKYLQTNVFEPCGMYNTGHYELDALPAKCANAYIRDEKRGGYYTNIYSVDAKGTAGGGAFTTVSDIDRFWGCLLDNKLISANLSEQMLMPQSGDGSKYYGFGIWFKKEGKGVFTPYIQGQDPGVSFISSYDIAEDTEITAVSNTGDNVWKLRRDLLPVIDSL
jgi:CubicO group peptidase (beta-lactamase class C family)